MLKENILLVPLILRLSETLEKEFLIKIRLEGFENLTRSHSEILIYLYRKGSATPQEIATKINRDKATITALTEKLCKFGYCKKQISKTDKRSHFLELTSTGILSAKKIFMLYLQINKRLIKKFGVTKSELIKNIFYDYLISNGEIL